jgi:phosphate/sulfate permease
MVCALVVSTTWVLFASSRGWPVSTTHSIVGALIGVGVAAFGWEGKICFFVVLHLKIRSN